MTATDPALPPAEAPEEDATLDTPAIEQEEASPPEETPEETAAPEAAAAPKLSAFDRGKLRALGMGQLITRLENTEGQLAAAHGEIATLQAENARLTAGRAAQEKTAREALEAAQKGRENEVSQGVREKLSTLGVPETDAPSATTTAEGQSITRAEFEKFDFTARNQFIRQNGKIVS